ncbi:MAG: hypothetical protein HY738_22835 [Bacteroidia bacterium]|nr:hypothetical protein [Bacteroidia bacterium]
MLKKEKYTGVLQGIKQIKSYQNIMFHNYIVKTLELKELKDLLAQFYAKKSISYANKAWKEKKLTNETMDKWLSEKLSQSNVT